MTSARVIFSYPVFIVYGLLLWKCLMLKQDLSSPLAYYSVTGNTYMDFTGSSLYSSRQVAEYSDELNKHVFGNPHSANPSSGLMTRLVDEV